MCPPWVVERWLPISRLSDYSVSTLGRVRRDTPGQGTRAGLLAQHISSGYPQVSIRPIGRVRVHILVAATWIGPRSDHTEINHLDGVKAHNCVWNLEYVTPSQNTQHAYATGLTPLAENRKQSKLTAAEMREIYPSQESYTTLAARYGVSKWTIRDIKRRRQWLREEELLRG